MITCRFQQFPDFGNESSFRDWPIASGDPAVTIHFYENDAKADLPKPCNAAKFRTPVTDFRQLYQKGLLPVVVNSSSHIRKIIWKKDIKSLDVNNYLPVFFEGLVENTYPYDILAFQGSLELIMNCRGLTLHCLPSLAMSIRKAFLCNLYSVVINACKVLQALVLSGRETGESMVSHYKSFLRPLSKFKDCRVVVRDQVQPKAGRKYKVSEIVLQTLQILDMTGGLEAYTIINKYIPTYDKYARSMIPVLDL